MLAHLRSYSDAWGDCITKTVAEVEPVLRAINPRTWIESTVYRELEFAPSLQSSAALRADPLTVFEALLTGC